MSEQALMLSSGEFAKICHISRELLIHYDRIGLLKPREIKSNGYRSYSTEQLYVFDTIRFYMDAGMSTQEVKDALDNQSMEFFLANAAILTDKLRE